MKLDDIKMKEDVIEPYKIFVDLDGVLVDFDKRSAELFNIDPREVEGDKQLKRQFWQNVKQHLAAGKQFWGDMDPRPDAFDLWGYVKKHNPTILTASGVTGKEQATREKHEWVRKHLGPNVPTIVVQDGKDKAQYAAPNHILIDDRMKAIGPWIDKGGVGILFTSAVQAIQELKKLGL